MGHPPRANLHISATGPREAGAGACLKRMGKPLQARNVFADRGDEKKFQDLWLGRQVVQPQPPPPRPLLIYSMDDRR
ncbi:hypothetical protein SBA6_880022 [Candidatus Sulfopaludibacter sp. SbA6]|nr:hypothetical protein SBA6_880022 [Candidatus Sulfopaludibacter sp. SbA6]